MTTPPAPSWAGPVEDMTALPAAKSVTWTSGQASNQLLSTAALIMGWSALETSGAAASSGQLVDGGDVNGQVIGNWGLGAGLAATVPIPPPGLMCKTGLYVHLKSGAATVTVWYIPIAPGA